MNKKLQLFIVGVILSYFSSARIYGNVNFRPTKVSQLIEFSNSNYLKEVEVIFVPNSNIIWADYKRLKSDFSFLQTLSNEQIDEWIIKSFSYISVLQLAVEKKRGNHIEVLKNKQMSYRGIHQGRGDTMVVKDQLGNASGLIDRKGVGIDEFNLKNYYSDIKIYKDGLLYTSKGIPEVYEMYMLQKIYDVVNSKLNTNYQTVEGYFLMEFPLKNGVKSTNRVPAIYGRQAHLGRIWTNKSPIRKLINTKQFDYFLATADAETILVKERAVSGIISKKIIKAFDFLEYHEIYEEYKNGDKYALSSFIEKKVEPLLKLSKGNSHQLIDNTSKKALHESYKEVSSWIIKDPKNYFRFAIPLLIAKERKMDEILKLKRVQTAILGLVKAGSFLQVNNNSSFERLILKQYAVQLIPALKREQAISLIKDIAFGKDEFSKKMISQTIWQMRIEDVKEYLPYILKNKENLSIFFEAIDSQNKRVKNFQNTRAMRTFGNEIKLKRGINSSCSSLINELFNSRKSIGNYFHTGLNSLF